MGFSGSTHVPRPLFTRPRRSNPNSQPTPNGFQTNIAVFLLTQQLSHERSLLAFAFALASCDKVLLGKNNSPCPSWRTLTYSKFHDLT